MIAGAAVAPVLPKSPAPHWRTVAKIVASKPSPAEAAAMDALFTPGEAMFFLPDDLWLAYRAPPMRPGNLNLLVIAKNFYGDGHAE